MAPALDLRLRQHLALTPQLQQALRLLQLSALEFAQEMGEALVNNPFLEESAEPKPQHSSSSSTLAEPAAATPAAPEAAPDTDGEEPDDEEREIRIRYDASPAERKRRREQRPSRREQRGVTAVRGRCVDRAVETHDVLSRGIADARNGVDRGRRRGAARPDQHGGG